MSSQVASAVMGTAGSPVVASEVPLALGGDASHLGSRGSVSLLCPVQLQDPMTASPWWAPHQRPLPCTAAIAASDLGRQRAPASHRPGVRQVVPTVGNRISLQREEKPPAKCHLISPPKQSRGMLVLIAFSRREQAWFCYDSKEKSQDSLTMDHFSQSRLFGRIHSYLFTLGEKIKCV